MLVMINHPIFWYVAGVLSATIVYITSRRLGIILVSRSELPEAEAPGPEPMSPSEQEARRHMKACQKRLLSQRKINPNWVEPLRRELPRLVQEIARTFHPKATNPLLAPSVGEFMRAIDRTASNLATFFQSPYGRVLNVSAETARKCYDMIERLRKYKQAVKWYKQLRPGLQILRYKSVLMWTLLLGRNVAVRSTHHRIAGIVGERAIELYGGKLVK
jgi:hypothetical protein